ncbi:MAG TPA: response regulator transcription factor, partial [Methylomirabilota bacterium]|nr:response regulator transcription factor [Methylomirabilota bacterium]
YCSVIEACREVHAWSRAREWTTALSRWCEEHSQPVAFTGTCRVHRAEILQFHGAWAEALAEAGRAGEPPAAAAGEPGRPLPAALYQQAEIHRLRGEFAEAEAAYRAASRLGHDPQPGLALLRLAQGRPDAAGAAIRRLVAATADPLPRARLLPAHVEIMLAHEDLPEARRAGLELRALAEALDADVLRAAAAQAEGAIALADGDGRAALGALRRAFEAWTRLEAPYEAARARVLVGRACRALGDEETRALEFAAARAAFERLGARPELARLDALERTDAGAPSRRTGRLTAREGEVLRLVAAGQTNRAIAARLGVSERTVDRHVSNILDKLDVPSRAAAIAQAYRRGLL